MMAEKEMKLSQPEMSVEDLMKMIKGFVDMLILATGYQSSGRFAQWDSSNMKRAFQWALFFENVLRCLKISNNYQNFEDLDAAISDMTSDPSFPQALASLSSDTLGCARILLSEQMVHALPLRPEHLRALIAATTELDLEELQALEPDYFNVYLDKLMLLSFSVPLTSKKGAMEKNSITSSVVSGQNMNQENFRVGDHSKYVIQELSRRQCSASCLLMAETNLNIISESASFDDLSKYQEDEDRAADTLSQEHFVDFVVWSRWRSGNLSYFVNSRTVRLVSGAKMIFSTPKLQWSNAFKQLILSSEDDSLETLEILLLGCISSQWERTIQHFMSVSFDLVDISNQYQELCNLLSRRSLRPQIDTKVACPKVRDILEYVTEFLGSQQNLLWKLSPALVASAIPSWSPLLRLYLIEIENQLKGEYSAARYCSCLNDGKEHTECTIAERIWCLHIFHVARPQPNPRQH